MKSNLLRCWILVAALVSGAIVTSTTAYGQTCDARQFSGSNGGQKIQAAIDSSGCTTIQVNPDGPDAFDLWVLTQPINLKSNMTLESSSSSTRPVLVASGTVSSWSSYAGMLIIDSKTSIVVDGLNLQAERVAPNGVWITNSGNVTFSDGWVVKAIYHGVHVTASPSSDIEISFTTFDANGLFGVRTDTSSSSSYHSTVSVHDNAIYASHYGIGLQNCGGSAITRCEILDNVIRPREETGTEPLGSGIDLNRSHEAVVEDNDIAGPGTACSYSDFTINCECGNGITIDDNQNSVIRRNTVDGCKEDGIVLANGALTANRPWWVSGNYVRCNTVQNNDGFGLRSDRVTADSDDHNIYNVWHDNVLSSNGTACRNNGEINTFYNNGSACLGNNAPANPPPTSCTQ